MLVYGTALYNGDGVPQDPVLGYAYVSRSAAQGLEPARNTLKQMDEIMPVEQRKKGVALAMQKAKTQQQAQSKPAATDSTKSSKAGFALRPRKKLQLRKRRLADPARSFFATIVSRGLVQEAIGKRSRRGSPAIPRRGGARNPAPGRPLPQQGGRSSCLQQPVRERPGLLPGGDEIVP